MLSSTLSFRSDKRVRSVPDRSPYERSASISKSKLFINNEYQPRQQSLFNERIRKIVAHGLFVFILLTGNCIQFSELAILPATVDDAEIVSETEETPCFCEGRFYKSCPPLPSCQSKLPYSSTKELYDHDDGHPDHVENIKPKSFDDLDYLEPTAPILTHSGGNYGAKNSFSNIVGDRIVRHRKVYVSERPAIKEPVIIPINLTIPVEFRDDPAVIIPPPKPIFKMRKYTTYETRPVIEKIPVTTTIIRPVGVTKDQIIDS